MRNKHAGILPVFEVVLLFCLRLTLRAEDQCSIYDRDRTSPSQAQGTESAALHARCQLSAGSVRTARQASCLVDLKPGDLQPFVPSVSTGGKLDRWLDLQAASVGIQYVFANNGLDVAAANQQQYQVAVRGRFKLDAQGRFSINAGVYTGANFIAGFNNTGLGAGKAQSNLYLKHLYFDALPLDGVEVQYGGLNIWHDESTDITGYTYKGYIAGERVRIKWPRQLFFDHVSVAYGYVGDINRPNVISRLHRLTQNNFRRFILKKIIGEWAWISADYVFQSGIQTWREAVRIHATELRVVNTIHAEIYEIANPHTGYGFAAYGEKTVLPKFVVGGGYADVDRPLLNSDRYGRGKRLFLTAKIPINDALSMLMFATQATDHAATNVPQQRFDIGLYYNWLYLLRKTRLF